MLKLIILTCIVSSSHLWLPLKISSCPLSHLFGLSSTKSPTLTFSLWKEYAYTQVRRNSHSWNALPHPLLFVWFRMLQNKAVSLVTFLNTFNLFETLKAKPWCVLESTATPKISLFSKISLATFDKFNLRIFLETVSAIWVMFWFNPVGTVALDRIRFWHWSSRGEPFAVTVIRSKRKVGDDIIPSSLQVEREAAWRKPGTKTTILSYEILEQALLFSIFLKMYRWYVCWE